MTLSYFENAHFFGPQLFVDFLLNLTEGVLWVKELIGILKK